MTHALSKVRATNLPRRGLSREEAAMYLGSTFDEMRSTGQIEPPRLIKSRKLWGIRDLDMTTRCRVKMISATLYARSCQ